MPPFAALAPFGAAMPKFAQTSDKPEPFGYKVSWFAVKASDPALVLDALAFGEGTQANWASGLEVAIPPPGIALRSVPWVFISPAISGWVLVIGTLLPYPVAPTEPHLEPQHHIGRKFDLVFSRLMMRFDDVQFFGSYRVADFVAWARARKGEPKRIFAYADGEVYANVGEQTPEEATLKFADFSGLSPPEASARMLKMQEEQEAELWSEAMSHSWTICFLEQHIADKRILRLVAKWLKIRGRPSREAQIRILQNPRVVPNEQDVIDLAALWSINPIRLPDAPHPLGLGLAARLPRSIAEFWPPSGTFDS